MTLPEFLTRDAGGFIHVTGHRIGLLHLVYYHNEGDSAARLLQRFPTLSPPLIEKVLDFYRENQAEVDAYVATCLTEMDQQRAAARQGPTLEELQRRLLAKQRGEGA